MTEQLGLNLKEMDKPVSELERQVLVRRFQNRAIEGTVPTAEMFFAQEIPPGSRSGRYILPPGEKGG